jgi:N-acyl homoserine lactone hydrolase
VTLLDDVRRVEFGYFVRPSEEMGTERPRVEPVFGYLVRQPEGWLLFDTGIGGGYADLDAHYRPHRQDLISAITAAGVGLDDVRWVANCHLHFDHSGGNPLFGNRPIYVQEGELETARSRDDYTLPELVDEGINYEVVSGETELLPGVFLIPTPGHVDGHQSLVLRCDDGTVICAGQAHDSASLFAYDVLAQKAIHDGLEEPLPLYPEWMKRFEQFDPARVVFAHDMSVLDFPFRTS